MITIKLLRSSIAVALSVCCATSWAMHPLLSDDTFTLGVQHSQIELNTDRLIGRGYDGRIADVTYTYGLYDNVDISFDMPFDMEPATGMNDVVLGLKWRFVEKDGLSFALTPVLVLPTANEQRGFGNGMYNPGIALIATYVRGSWTWLGNVGLLSNRYRQPQLRAANRALIHRASLAVTYAINPQWMMVADAGVTQNMNRSEKGKPAYFLFGVVYSPNQTIDLDVGIKFGLNHAGPSSQTGVGLTVHF